MVRTESAAQVAAAERIEVVGRSGIDDLIDNEDPLTHCYIFIDVSKLVQAIFRLLKWGGRPMTPQQIACFMSGMGR